MSFMNSNGLLTAAFLLSLGTTVNVFAQQYPSSEGIVRITDGRVRTNGRQAGGRPVMQASAYQNDATAAPSSGTSPATPVVGGTVGYSAADCQYGDCPADGTCQYHGCRWGCFDEHCYKHSPDYGYSPPAKYPLHRRGVEYTNYYPTQWYGAGADYSQSQAPMVYQPTDTTQLGFYYQHVPFWRPQPNRVPERPIPAQWHITPPPVHPLYSGGYGRCRSGYCPNGYGVNEWCPTNATWQDGNGSAPVGQPMITPPQQTTPAPVQSPSPATLPSEPGNAEAGLVPNPLPALQSTVPSPSPAYTPVQPLPSTNSAASGHIRRIGYQYR